MYRKDCIAISISKQNQKEKHNNNKNGKYNSCCPQVGNTWSIPVPRSDFGFSSVYKIC